MIKSFYKIAGLKLAILIYFLLQTHFIVAQDTSLLLAQYLNNDINLIADDLQHLRWRYNKKEINNLPLVSVSTRNKEKISGFLISHEKNTNVNNITLEYEGNINVVPLYSVYSFGIDQVKEFAHYFVPINKDNIEQTATKLSLIQKVAELESILDNEGLQIKIKPGNVEALNPKEIWLYKQLLIDVCMAIVEACGQKIVKETLQMQLKEIEFSVGGNNAYSVKSKTTLQVIMAFSKTQSTRSQRAEIIDQIMNSY